MKDINYILEMIPHRYPFLLVDKVISKKEKKEIKTLKNVTICLLYTSPSPRD